MKTSNAAPGTNKSNHDPCKNKPYNRYNIFYILERERFLQSNPSYKTSIAGSTAAASSPNIVTGYENLDLPDLPQRYAHLDLAFDWYMPGKRKATKRDHKKSHGLASFQEIARFVADGYRNIDDDTFKYITTVAALLKQRHEELKKTKEMECLVRMESSVNTSNLDHRDYSEIQFNPMMPCHDWAYHDWTSMSSSYRQDNRVQHYPKETCRDWACGPKISDLIVHSPPVVAVGCSPSKSDGINRSTSPTGASEVDMPDRAIMKMWYLY
mmetsp:Transcript_31605/g.53902  ORF Transcript_31605/g.53902 Transcript_31605/m.53902 type:complete len:268 (+) Transcript_31605:154-957(+)